MFCLTNGIAYITSRSGIYVIADTCWQQSSGLEPEVKGLGFSTCKDYNPLANNIVCEVEVSFDYASLDLETRVVVQQLTRAWRANDSQKTSLKNGNTAP